MKSPSKTPGSPTPPGPGGPTAGHGRLGLRLIGAMKVGSSLLLLAAVFGLFRMVNAGLGQSLEHIAFRLHLDPENRLVRGVVTGLGGLDRTHLRMIEVGALFYAALHMAEGTGLILGKRWAEYLTVVATGSLLPLEVWEVVQKVTAIRAAVLLINVAVLVYVIFKLRQQRRAEPAPA